MILIVLAKKHCPSFTVVTIEVVPDILHYFWCDNITINIVAFYNLISWSGLKTVWVDFKIVKSEFAESKYMEHFVNLNKFVNYCDLDGVANIQWILCDSCLAIVS
jgi:hypothetical protein